LPRSAGNYRDVLRSRKGKKRLPSKRKERGKERGHELTGMLLVAELGKCATIRTVGKSRGKKQRKERGKDRGLQSIEMP
jgi:hypothetical protein